MSKKKIIVVQAPSGAASQASLPSKVRIPVPKVIQNHPEVQANTERGFEVDALLLSLSQDFAVTCDPVPNSRSTLGAVLIDGDPAKVEAAGHKLRTIFTSEATRVQALLAEKSREYKAKQQLPAVAKLDEIKLEGRTVHQREYLDEMDLRRMVVGIGPAGTGKTFLAVGKACQKLRDGSVKRIVVARPTVAVDGEELPWLPGDIRAKSEQWLRPVYDSFYKFIGKEMTEKLIDDGIIEIAPLGMIRGRTYDDAFIIVDEAQNMTVGQMKVLVTRPGNNCWVILNGDLTQLDLRPGVTNGIQDLMDLEKHMPDDQKHLYGRRMFDYSDVNRGPIAKMAVGAYTARDKAREAEQVSAAKPKIHAVPS